MGRNGQRRPARPRIEVTAGGAVSDEEAVAIASAIEQFMRDTAPASAPSCEPSPWLRAGLVEATGRAPWGEPGPWGS